MRGLGEVARPGDAQPLGVGDDERAGRVRPAQPLLAGDRQEVEAVRVDRDRAHRLGAVDEDRDARALAQLVHRQERGRSSRGRARAASRRVRGVTAARIASGSASTTTTRAPLACTGPSRPKCSSSVVTISSSGPRPSPASTMLQPSVVEPVSATCSGVDTDERGESCAHVAPQLEHALEVRLADSAALEVGLRAAACTASNGRAGERAERAGVEVRDALEHREQRARLLEASSDRDLDGCVIGEHDAILAPALDAARR